MNKEKSLDLFALGRDDWNAWAERMLSNREALEAAGAWIDSSRDDDWNHETRQWRAAAVADFRQNRFHEDANFSNFIFPHDALFNESVFSGDVQFDGAKFGGKAQFGLAQFGGKGVFNTAIFSDDAEFGRTTFRGEAGFGSAKFNGHVNFVNAIFEGHVTFNDAIIGKDGRFRFAKFVSDAEFCNVAFADSAGFHEATFERGANFREAHIAGGAWFEKVTFTGDALFANAIFTGNATFKNSVFCSDAGFDSAAFLCEAKFEGTSFRRFADLHKATFNGDTQFSAVTFNRNVRFDEATFKGDARFGRAVFAGLSSFDGAQFESTGSFDAVEAKSAFSLAGATFLAVPDFIQAHFSEAPRLDDIRIEQQRFRPITLTRIKGIFKGDPELAARWRALKRVAIQGHDHAREQEFFKGEIKARRRREDKFFHGAFLVGFLYQWLSDFGGSVWRPFFWWVVSAFGFTVLYLDRHPALLNEPSAIRWAFKPVIGFRGEAPLLACVAGPGDPWRAAFTLSIQKGLLLPGLVPVAKLNQLYACLYGIHPDSFSPVIPDSVTWLGIAQQALSAILIFLLLLAIRNHFRIK